MKGPALRGAAGGRRDLRRREDLFRPQRHLVLQQDRACRRSSPRATSCCSTATTTRRRIMARCFIGGGIPIFLETDRNAHGLIGPIFHRGARRGRASARRSAPTRSSRTREAWRRERPFRVAVIEQCTYDGTIYDAAMIVEQIGHLCDYILFDEAWAGFMKFHPLYAGRFAMGLKQPRRRSRRASSPRSRRTSSSRASRRPRRSTSRTATSRASAAASSTAASTNSSCCTPRPRRSIRSSPRSTSARR